MKMKIKVIGAIAAVAVIVGTAFGQSPLLTHNPIYHVTGRVIQMNADTIVIRGRSPDRGNFVVYHTPDTRFQGSVRVGDTVTIDYKMAAVNITPVGSPRSR